MNNLFKVLTSPGLKTHPTDEYEILEQVREYSLQL